MTDHDLGWLVQGSPSLLLVLDDSLECRAMASAWRERLDPGLLGTGAIPAAKLFDLDAQPELLDQLEAVLIDGAPIINTAVGVRLADGILPCRFGAWRAQDEGKGPPSVVVAATDVSRFRAAMADLSKLQQQQRLILDAAGEGIYGLDLDGRITFGNAATRILLGWDPEKVLGRKAHKLHHHSHADGSAYPQDECPIYATLTDGEAHTVDSEVFWHEDGSAVPIEYASTPIFNDGRLEGGVVVFRDISERKAMQREREEAFEEIRQLRDQLEQERDYLRDEISTAANFGEIIGDSHALKRALAQVEAVAETPVSVLILGESGVGKEMVARAIHSQSDRADKPLIKVNCASVPKDLFESEFFGHVRGSFTGAHQDRIGRLQLANGGTLFLDEIGEIPMSEQGKLLRALQEGEFERVGDEKTTNVDVRVISATNRNLNDEVNAGRFREDLYYRVSVFPVEVPPLRDRADDIAPLALHFLETICRELGRETMRMTQNQLESLKRQPWRGNIRELKNVIERAVISSQSDRLRLDLALNPTLGNALEESERPAMVSAGSMNFVTAREFKELEKANLIAALRHANWKTWGTGGAAELLGVKPSTLTYRIKALGIVKDRDDGPRR